MPSVWDTATSLASGPRVQIQTSRCKESRLPFIGDDEQDTPKGTKARARTNARGQAQLTFQLPELAGAREDQEVDLEIRGTRGYFHNSLTSTLHFWRRAAILLSTDKPLYQPDQTLHMRARSEEHTSELQSPCNLVCRLLLEKKNWKIACEAVCFGGRF